MPIWLQAMIAVSLFWAAAVVVGRRVGPFRLARVWVAGFVLLAVALVLDQLGLRATGWAALALVVFLFVVGAAFAFVREWSAS